jgi:RNase P subunit RPR2
MWLRGLGVVVVRRCRAFQVTCRSHPRRLLPSEKSLGGSRPPACQRGLSWPSASIFPAPSPRNYCGQDKTYQEAEEVKKMNEIKSLFCKNCSGQNTVIIATGVPHGQVRKYVISILCGDCKLKFSKYNDQIKLFTVKSAYWMALNKLMLMQDCGATSFRPDGERPCWKLI